MSIRLCALCFAAGLCGGILNGALAPLRTRAGRVFTVITDVILAFLSVGAHAAATFFYGDGRIFPYAVAVQALGFLLTARLSAGFLRAVRKRLPAKKKKDARPLA